MHWEPSKTNPRCIGGPSPRKPFHNEPAVHINSSKSPSCNMNIAPNHPPEPKTWRFWCFGGNKNLIYPTFGWLVTEYILEHHIFWSCPGRVGNSNPRTTRPPIKSSDCRLSNPTRKGKKPPRDKYLKHEDLKNRNEMWQCRYIVRYWNDNVFIWVLSRCVKKLKV